MGENYFRHDVLGERPKNFQWEGVLVSYCETEFVLSLLLGCKKGEHPGDLLERMQGSSETSANENCSKFKVYTRRIQT